MSSRVVANALGMLGLVFVRLVVAPTSLRYLSLELALFALFLLNILSLLFAPKQKTPLVPPSPKKLFKPLHSPQPPANLPVSPAPSTPLQSSSFSRLSSPFSPNSKSPSSAFRDKRSVDRLLDDFKKSPPPASPVSQSALPFSPTPLITKFKTASKSKESERKLERYQDGLVVKDPEELMSEVNIDFIDDAVEDIRKWIATKIFTPLSQKISRIDTFFKENGIQHLDCSHIVSNLATQLPQQQQPSTQPSVFGTSSTFGTIGTTSAFGTSSVGTGLSKPGLFSMTAKQEKAPQSLLELIQKYGNVKEVEERLKVENYLNMPEFECREYIIERIHSLSKGGYLTGYNWNAGQKFNQKEWTPELYPTDAQLVIHLFCRYFDENLPWENQSVYGNTPFSSKYFVGHGGKIDGTRSVSIRFANKNPPHFYLVVEKEIWEVWPKRNNVFHTIILFALYMKRAAGGYLGPLNLGGKSIGLIQSISKIEKNVGGINL